MFTGPRLQKPKDKLTPVQLLVSGYIFVVLAGAILLSLPISSSKGIPQNFVDALFVSVSGISTSGLTPVDIGSFYSFFGQMVLLILFQIGGISYTTFFIFLAYIIGMKTGLMPKIVAKESLSGATVGDIFKFFRRVVIFTFLFEFIGAVTLAIYWVKEFSVSRAIYLGIFHSVSTFCTAGFGLFPDSLISCQKNIGINWTINLISLAGGIGFFVLYDVYTFLKKTIKREYPRRLSVHSKLAIAVTIIVALIGTIVIFVSEKWPSSLDLKYKLLNSSFQAISASTTDGFNSMDIGSMSPTSLFMLIILMFAGASPGGTGGGIKTTTLGIILLAVWAHLTKKDLNLFKRRISNDTIDSAFAIFSWFIFVVAADMLILTFTENATFLQILFEIVSALGNTGLSMGITSGLSNIAKIVLTITMFVGRVGPLAAGFFLIGRSKPVFFRYAEAEVFIG